ncbi:hypothetical protein HYU14_04260 [Candidatus Woesearchaeota archaeon]|nr:hypothetical protein [Candidatus Woesearchaeota archaeon]
MSSVSTVKKIDLKKAEVHSLILLNRMISGSDMQFLASEFDFTGGMVDFFSGNYRNLGIVFRLATINPEASGSRDPFLRRVFPRMEQNSKFDNAFLSRDCAKLLLVTNKRLLKLDMERANEKILDANFMIEHMNEKTENREEASGEEPRQGMFRRMIEALR